MVTSKTDNKATQGRRQDRAVSAPQRWRVTVAYLEIGIGVCHNLRRGADTPGAPVLMIDITAACDTSKTPYVAIDERGLVRSIHLFFFSCVH